jgi:hypothetical protein
MKHIFYTYFILLLIITSCNTNKKVNANESAIIEAKQLIKEGDLIVRLEDDFISRLIADLSPKDKKYSHCGIVGKKDKKLVVYNILPGQTGKEGVSITPFDSFINPQIHEKFAVYRYSLQKKETIKMLSSLQQMVDSSVKYDLKFDYKTNNEIYCSELVAKAISVATEGKYEIEKCYIDKTRIMGVKRYFKFMNDTVDLSKYPIVSIDNLYLNNFTTPIYQFTFDKSLNNRMEYYKKNK